MKHLGNISNINGAEIDPVDLITFGSPCQDLSVAGKRAGIKHAANGDEEATRSGLFMEAVRIIKEMREATNGKYPRFALWENVPGAFSSNKGEDFRIVCEELIKIVEKNAVMPQVPKTGWPYADCYSGNGWSLAYRTFDTQYWPGTPQRRRRIHLVADFSGECAKEILFEREGLRRDYASGRPPWERTATDAESGIGTEDSAKGEKLNVSSVLPFDTTQITNPQSGSNPQWGNPCHTLAAQGHPPAIVYAPVVIDSVGGQAESAKETDIAPTLKASHYKFPPSVALSAGFCTEHSAKAGGVGYQDECAPTLRAGTIPATVCTTYDARGNGCGSTVNTITGDHENRITDYSSVIVQQSPVYCLQGNGIDRADTAECNGKGWKEDTGYTLNTVDRPAVAYATDVGFFNSCEEQSPTLLARGHKDPHLVTYPQEEVQYTVRRLTPTECARLQGFADDWGHPDKKDDMTPDEYQFWLDVRNTHAAINGKKTKDYTKAQMLAWYNKLHSDSAEYKMWGNGIALPPALYCMQGIADVLQRRAVN